MRTTQSTLEAVKNGLFHASMTDELTRIETRISEILALRSQAPAPSPVIHPNLAELYRRKVERLHESLDEENTR